MIGKLYSIAKLARQRADASSQSISFHRWAQLRGRRCEPGDFHIAMIRHNCSLDCPIPSISNALFSCLNQAHWQTTGGSFSMWTPKLDQAIFIREEGYVWTETRNKFHWKLVAVASLAIMAGVIVSTVV